VSAVAEWVGVVVGSTTAGSLVTAFFNRRKLKAEGNRLDAEAAHVIAQTAVTLVAPLQAQVTELLGRVEALEDENEATRTTLGKAFSYIRELLRWVREHLPDLTPPMPPPGLKL